MNFLFAGAGSDIVKELLVRLKADAHSVECYPGRVPRVPDTPWDVLVIAQGRLDPIGKFFDCFPDIWWESVEANALIPLTSLRLAWGKRNPGATVVFIGGPNLKHPTPTYTAYRAGKAVIHALVETLGAEYPETKFRLFHPGVVKTKIHYQTINAGARAGNFQRVMGIVNGMEKTVSHDQVYEKFKSLLEEK